MVILVLPLIMPRFMLNACNWCHTQPCEANKGKSRCELTEEDDRSLDDEGFAVKPANPQFYLSPRFMYEKFCHAAKKNLLLREICFSTSF